MTSDGDTIALARRLLPHAASFAVGVSLSLFGLLLLFPRAPFRVAGLGLIAVVTGLMLAFVALFTALSVVLE